MDPAPDYVDERGSRESVASDGDEPTDEERHQLRHVSDKLPKSAWLVAVVELCERFAFYGLSGPFQNYIQNGRHGAVPGALGV
jgi:proton-dependent oligopeptide transporter, POT family